MFGKKAKLINESIVNSFQYSQKSSFHSPNLLKLFSNKYQNDNSYNYNYVRKRKFMYENIDINEVTKQKEKEYQEYDTQTIDLIKKTFFVNEKDQEKNTLKKKFYENDELTEDEEGLIKLTDKFRKTIKDIMSKKIKNNINISGINPIEETFYNYNKENDVNQQNINTIVSQFLPENVKCENKTKFEDYQIVSIEHKFEKVDWSTIQVISEIKTISSKTRQNAHIQSNKEINISQSQFKDENIANKEKITKEKKNENVENHEEIQNENMKNKEEIKIENIDENVKNRDENMENNKDENIENMDVNMGNKVETIENKDENIENMDIIMENTDENMETNDENIENTDVNMKNTDENMEKKDENTIDNLNNIKNESQIIENNSKSNKITQEISSNRTQSNIHETNLNPQNITTENIQSLPIIPKTYNSNQLSISEHLDIFLINTIFEDPIITNLQSSISNFQNTITSQQTLISTLQSELDQLTSTNSQLYSSLSILESHRKLAQEYIHSLKGNLRVYCRIRPPSNQEESFITYPELSKLSSTSQTTQTLSILEIKNTQSNQTFAFTFDRVFPETSTQIEIFSEVKQFIQSALDGDNICIFAYGATGSGKTFTMQGYSTSNNPESSGILPRCAEFIFSEKRRLVTQKEDINISFAAMEIYNENLFDLLSSINRTPSPIKNAKKKSLYKNTNKVPLTIYSAGNEVNIPNLKWADILNESDIIKYTNIACESRRCDSTSYNATSSRSHAIFQIKIQNMQKKKMSMINIIDLAGSERSQLTSFNKMTKEEIEAKKKIQSEANFINKSLSALGRIINLIGDKKNANTKISIPYRDSKLTIVLQNYLKPNAKTVMIVNVACESKNYNYTKESLNFAANAMVNC